MKVCTTWLARSLAALGIVLLALTGCGGGGDGGGGPIVLPILPPGGEPPPPPSTGRLESFALRAASTGITYPIEVYLPPSYRESTRSYPTIYVLDGDARFNLGESRFANFRTLLDRHKKEAILIGIGNTDRRDTDYTLPGGHRYHDFLAGQLVPLIEERYRADPGMRMLTGLSLSGSYVAIALLIEAQHEMVFSHFLSSDGAFHSDYLAQIKSLDAQTHRIVGDRPIPATLVLASGSGGVSNERAVEEFNAYMRMRNYKGLGLVYLKFNAGHTPMDLPAFENAINRFID